MCGRESSVSFQTIAPWLRPDVVSIDDFPPVFISCFSAEENDLSQWRAYGGGEGGVSLGFCSASLGQRTRDLQSHIEYGRAWLVPVVYDEMKQQELIARYLIDSADLFVSHLPDTKHDPEDFFVSWHQHWRLFSSLLACIAKDVSFQQEYEWRLIVQSFEPSELFFRPNRTMLCPYLKLPLGKGRANAQAESTEGIEQNRHMPGQIPLKKTWTGPNRFKDLAFPSVKTVLKKFAYDSVKLEQSSIPYRVT